MAGRMQWKDIFGVLRQSGAEWSEDKATKMAGALAYYTAISIAPLLVVAVVVITLFYGQQAPEKLRSEISTLTSPDVAKALQDIITNSAHKNGGITALVISIVVALFGASGVFAELQDSLNTIWEVRPKPGRGIMGLIKDRSRSIALVGVVAFLLLVSLVATTILSGASNAVIAHTVGSDGTTAKIVGFVIEFVLSTGVVTVLFAAMFKWLPDVTVRWKDVWLGGFFTAVLFGVGKLGIGVYMGKAAPGSAFGAVGSIVVMLVWIYYSSLILFYGAEVTQVYANKFGTKIVPSSNAIPLTEDMRQQQGIAHDDDSASHPDNVAARTSPRPVNVGIKPVRPVVPSDKGRRITEFGIPVLAMIVVGRFAWRRTQHLKVKAKTAGTLWQEAGSKWKRLGQLFTVPAARRYAMTHGPERENRTWSEIAEEVKA